MIVPIEPHAVTDLSRAVTAWIDISKDLAAGCTVSQAVQKWNNKAGGTSYDYRIEPNGSATRLRPQRPGYVCQ
jgi:hypothetical protein